jgi:anti-sigma factor RsiW
MNTSPRHPDDLNPYLDRDFSDKRYEEIRKHLEICPECRGEIAAQQSLDQMFRSPDFELEVPAWQWSRIRAGLLETKPAAGWFDRVRALSQPRRFVWGIALSVLIFTAIAVSVWQYRQEAARDDLMQLAQYSEVEQVRLRAAANPFRVAVISGNPFTGIHNGSVQRRGNPFAIR